jgi:chemotaxis-related protein WspD
MSTRDLVLDMPGAAVDAAVDDCWNKIGVHGDASCPELMRHAHCRNCPVYSATALTLLDRDLPAEHLSEWTEHFAQAKSIAQPDTESAIIFRVGAELFAFSTLVLDEVAELRTIHSLPHRRNGAVLGLANMRGELALCVSLRKMLGLGEAPAADSERGSAVHGRLVIVRHEGERTAFPVDEVHSTHRYHPRELRAAPATILKAAAAYTKALLSWQDKTVGLLDDQLIIHAVKKSVA